MLLSVVIPIYNSQKQIKDTAERVIDILSKQSSEFEILFQDDGSSDQSQDVLREVDRKYKNVKCFYNTENKGLGHTLRQLFKRAKGSIVIYCDCDLPFGDKFLARVQEDLAESDVVVYSRYKDIRNKVPFSRKFTSRCYYYLCRQLFNILVADIGSGTVVLKRAVIEKVSLTSDGFAVHAEMFKRIQDKGFVIKEIPAPVNGYVPGSFSILRHGPRIVADTLGLLKVIRKN